MYISNIVQIAIILIFAIGVYMALTAFNFNSSPISIRYRDGPLYRYKKIKSALMDNSRDYIFESAGINLSIKKYIVIRKLCFSVCIIYSLFQLAKGDIYGTQKLLIISIAFYYITSPKETMNGRTSPLYYVLTKLRSRRLEKMDEELAGIIMQMQNIIISNDNMSADYLMTRLLPFTNLTKQAFAMSLRFVRQGDARMATTSFSKHFGTKLGESFANIIVKLDVLPADEFKEQLRAIQKRAESERRTRRDSKNTRLNTIRYMFAMAWAFIIAGNFLYLIVVDSMKALTLLQ
ncbi:MAG: hypothetical protein ACK5MV_03970 [Aminipila sp.]